MDRHELSQYIVVNCYFNPLDISAFFEIRGFDYQNFAYETGFQMVLKGLLYSFEIKMFGCYLKTFSL